MSNPLSTVREAILAELIGDVQQLLDRVEKLGGMLKSVDEHAQGTARTLKEANEAYQAGLNDMMARLRVEYSDLIGKVTEQAAISLVGQQTDTLQKAATAAIRKALTQENVKRARADWYKLVAIAAAVGGSCAGLVAAILGVVMR